MTTILEAVLQPDGMTLRLAKPVKLPPGPVEVEVRALEIRQGPGVLEVLERIHREQREQGRATMTEDEMAREIEQMRAEQDDDERWQGIWSQTRTDAAEKRGC